jgi:hypothetical protein
MGTKNNSCKIVNAELSILMEGNLQTASPCSSTTEENATEFLLDSGGYKDFLRLVEENVWVPQQSYELFYKNNDIRRERLLVAVFNGKIRYQISIETGEILDDGLQEIDENKKSIIAGCVNNIYDNVWLPASLLLEGASFLSWLKEEYPYEGAEQTKEASKENNSFSDKTISVKREINLIKVIGGFLRTMYQRK